MQLFEDTINATTSMQYFWFLIDFLFNLRVSHLCFRVGFSPSCDCKWSWQPLEIERAAFPLSNKSSFFPDLFFANYTLRENAGISNLNFGVHRSECA